jgi:hypothetical protein
MDDDFFDFIVIPFLIAVFLAGLVFGLMSLSDASDHDDCHAKGDLAEVQVTYRAGEGGCFVNHNGLWMPFDKWKYNRDHGLLK